MGTTLVAASIQGNTLYVANVGDSRLYRIERSGIHQITRDHSYVEAMVSLGQMSRGSREYETKKNIITRAVGIGGHVEPDFFEVSLNPGDYVLLCSDGLTNMVDNSAIYRMVLLPGTLDTKARALTALANQNGGKDNIAVILIDPQIRGGERIMMLKPGTYLQDRYEILSLIGTGGMSEVYQAKCHTLNRLVAIKVLKDEYSQDANFVSKFKMEAQAAAGLSHPNIVSVYDVVDEGSLHYIVMELIEGITLKSYILKKGHLGVKETIGIAIQVAQGLAAAHDQHIVHRDIKPQNMIISRDGKVKVADFGIARAVSSQTIGVNAVGSVHYISPEQAKGNYSDGRSDLYSLGITMYEMLTGKLPFDGDNPVSVALAHLEEPVQPPSRINPEVSASLDRIILKCTQKKPERRYQNAYELIADLRHALVDPNDDFLKKNRNLMKIPRQSCAGQRN
ncbi:MAG: protein kinase domain-containing protein [Clostridium fessum]